MRHPLFFVCYKKYNYIANLFYNLTHCTTMPTKPHDKVTLLLIISLYIKETNIC